MFEKEKKTKQQLQQELFQLKKSTLSLIQDQTDVAQKSLYRLFRKNIVEFFTLTGIIIGLIYGAILSPLLVIILSIVGFCLGYIIGKSAYGLIDTLRRCFSAKRQIFSQETEFKIKDFLDYLNEDTIRPDDIIKKQCQKILQSCIEFYAKIPKQDLETWPKLNHNKTNLLSIRHLYRKNLNDEEKIEHLQLIQKHITESDPIIKQLVNTPTIFNLLDSL